MRIVKYLLYGFGGLVLLAVVALVAAVLIVDGAFVKNRLERTMKQERQRTLKIEGVPKLSLFPKLSLSFGKTTLSERASEKEFLSFESLSASVAVMPLLSNVVAVDAISLTGVSVQVVRAKDGTFNFADLTGEPDDKPKEVKEKAKDELKAELKELPKVRVAEVRIERAQIAYRDEQTGQELRVSDLNLKTGRLEDDTPSDISFSAQVTGKRPDVDLRAELKGAASLNLAKKTFALAKLDGKVRGIAGPVRGLEGQISGSIAANPDRGELNASEFSVVAKGTYEKDAFNLAIAAPQLAVTRGKAAGAAVTAELKMKGPSRNVDAKFKLDGLEGSAEALSIAALALDLDAAVAPNAVKGKISTPVKGNLKAQSWELPKIVADLTITSPNIPQKTVTLPLRASAKANLEKHTAAAELMTTFDESTIHVKLGATKLDPLVATFDLKVDRLNMDRYLPPPKKESNPNEKLDLSMLKGPTATGKAEIG
ncbi:MAG: AsmA family protein, partial [Burkholderiales bacterium]